MDNSTSSYDLIVVGGGPAGYVGAIRAAQLGKKVALIEREKMGGTCLNWGCIPTKALLKNAEIYSIFKNHATDFGISYSNLEYSWEKIISRSRVVANNLANGIDFLLRKNKITALSGTASLLENKMVNVLNNSQVTHTLSAKNILLATGVVSREMSALPFNGKNIIGSRQALCLQKQPKKIVIIGSGAIGVEFAYFFNSFGTEVTLIEMMPHILPQEDQEISEALKKSLVKKGIQVITTTQVTDAVKLKNDCLELNLKGERNDSIIAEMVLVSIGVSPLLPETKIPFELDLKGYIAVNNSYETNIKTVFAAGDIIGPPWLAHVASFEAVQAVNGMFGHSTPIRKRTFPSCTYCQPQVASVGITEKVAIEKGMKFKIGKFPFQAVGKAQAINETDGFVKLLFNEPHGELIGAHILGSEATEMIAELGLALTLEATYDDIMATIHAHPTLSEAIFEATEASHGLAIHI